MSAISFEDMMSAMKKPYEERDALQAERDSLKAERDALKAERDSLQGERDSLQAERDRLKARRNFLMNAVDKASEGCRIAREERDSLQAERDYFKAIATKAEAQRLKRNKASKEKYAKQKAELAALRRYRAASKPVTYEYELISIGDEAYMTKNGNVYEYNKTTEVIGDYVGRLTGDEDDPAIDADGLEVTE